jgi:4,5-dihydroxyphthalate decarboxylase
MTDSVTLKAAFATYPHTKAIKDGTVSSPRIRFVFEEMPVIHRAFRRMVRTGDFDISEMALTTLAQAVAFDKPIAGLPVVVMRGFHHAATVVPKDSRLAAPADLHGKCVGVRAFSQTTGIWVRGILGDEYGLDWKQVTWMLDEDAHTAEYIDPPNSRRIAPDQDLGSMLLKGDIEAGIALRDIDASLVRPIVPNPMEAAAAWFGKTGCYPVNHVICLKTELVKQHPWLPEELMRLFEASKDAATEPSAEAKFAPIVGTGVLPYGVEANRIGIETCLRYAAEQGLVPRIYTPEEIFV